MASRNKILVVTATTDEGLLAEKVNKKLDLLPQYRVVTATSIFLGINILMTIVLELIEPPKRGHDTNAQETETGRHFPG